MQLCSRGDDLTIFFQTFFKNIYSDFKTFDHFIKLKFRHIDLLTF